MSYFYKASLIFLLTLNLALVSWSSIDPGKNSRQAREGAKFGCLPEGYTSADVVSYREKRKQAYVTIDDKLVELKAHCKEGKLVDGKGREIRFFKFACYGNPPIDYEELKQKELQELEKLQKKYCVIVMECDPRTS